MNATFFAILRLILSGAMLGIALFAPLFTGHFVYPEAESGQVVTKILHETLLQRLSSAAPLLAAALAAALSLSAFLALLNLILPGKRLLGTTGKWLFFAALLLFAAGLFIASQTNTRY